MARKKRKSSFASHGLMVLSLLFWLGLDLSLFAQDQTISQMVHTSWTGKDGAPQAITALAQTPDGMLWIGSSAGLFSFDGLRFAAFDPSPGSTPLPSRGIRSLFVSKDGDLWILWFHGPPACIHQGSVHFYDHAGDEPINVLGDLQEDSRGTLWSVLNWHQLVRLESDNVWHPVENPIASAGHVSKIFIDSSDTQWVIENDLLYRKPADKTAFTATGAYVYGPATLAEDREHTLWLTGQGPGPPSALSLQHLDRTGHRLFAPPIEGQVSDILLASDDSLWISIIDAGLQQIRARDHSDRSANAQDRYEYKSGITGLGVQTLLRDAEGNIWVGGMGGLDRFKHADLVPAIASKVGIWFTCADPQGDAWIANGSGQLFRVKSGSARQILAGGGATNLFCGTEGRAYLIRDSGISILRGGHVSHLPLLPGLSGYGDHYLFLGLIEETDGQVIAATGGSAGHGLWRYDGKKWSAFLPNLALPEVCAMLEGAQEGLYVAFTGSDDRVDRIRMSADETFTVPIRPIGFRQTSYGIFAYGSKGIALDRGERFQVFWFVHPEQGTMVSGLVEANNGDLWLMGARGVVRVPAAEVRAVITDPRHALSSMNFREGDFVGPDVFLLFRHSADIDRNGRLWFSFLNGVVSVDPDHLAAPRMSPQLSIRSITADGRSLRSNGTLPPDTQYLDIKYFGLDLGDPTNVVYRYRLEGLDTAWQDVGSRTEAIYTHLRPGSYRFQVMASNGNDQWTAPVSSALFTVLPRFYERPWVQGLFVLAGLALVWAGISVRVKYISGAIKIRAEERADERIRIARELHDTLLQGVQGLLLSFHVAAQKVPSNHESKVALEKALTTADRIILEGRNRVSRLRSESVTDAELKSLIEDVAANLNDIRAIDVTVERRGVENALQNHVVDEIFCIAREALTNAFRHSDASRIAVELDYQKREFKMICRDNGRGFEVKTLLASKTNGHWGVRGMAERAEKIGANFTFTSAPDKGTQVDITMPGRLAYVRPCRFRDFFARSSAAQ